MSKYLLGVVAAFALVVTVADAQTFTRDLTIGSTGSDVVALQDVLIAGNYLVMPAGVSKGYFGALTKAAVAKWQAAVGITPAAGYFGPISRAKLAMDPSTPTTPSTGDSSSTKLNGSAGSIDEAKFISSLNNEEVGEGKEDVEVMGLGVKPENSDISLAALKVTLQKSTSGGSSNINKYAEEVSVWLDGKEIGRSDISDFKKDSTAKYSRTISLKNAVIRDGKIGKLTVAVSAVSNIDSNDAGKVWNVKVSDIRYQDAQGAIITENNTGDIDSNRGFTFEEFSTASNMKFKILGGDSSINNARTIEVSSTTRTTDVPVLSFKMKIEGDSGMNLDEVLVAATTSNTTLGNVISAAYLYVDGDRVGSESISGSGFSILFDDLDLDLDADTTYDAEIRVDLQKATGAFVTGTTIDVDATSTALWAIEDENGDDVKSADRSGSASADAHILATEGLQIKTKTLKAESLNPSTQNSTTAYANFEVEVELSAIGDTLYVKETAASSTVALSSVGLSYVFEDANGNQVVTASSTSASFTHVSGGTTDGASIRIDENSKAIFKLVATFDPSAAAGQYRVRVVGAGFGLTNSGTGSSQAATPAINYRTSNVYVAN